MRQFNRPFTVMAILLVALILGACQPMAMPTPVPLAEANKASIARYFEAISGKDKPDAVQEQYIADSDEVLKQHIAFFEASFPHYELIAEDMIAEGDKVSVLVRFRGVHQGELLGIAPTGKEVDVPFAITYRLEGGKIVEHWMSFDRMALMEQLGVVPTGE